MAPTSRPQRSTRHRPKSDTEAESPVERAFRHGNVRRDAVLMVLDSTMSDERKLAYLRAWVTDSPIQEPQAQPSAVVPAKPVQDWTHLPAYSVAAAS